MDTVLIIEDERLFLMLARDGLEKAGTPCARQRIPLRR